MILGHQEVIGSIWLWANPMSLLVLVDHDKYRVVGWYHIYRVYVITHVAW